MRKGKYIIATIYNIYIAAVHTHNRYLILISCASNHIHIMVSNRYIIYIIIFTYNIKVK